MIEEIAPDAVAIGRRTSSMTSGSGAYEGHNLYIESRWGCRSTRPLLAHLAEQNGCITQVSFQRRSCPMVVKLRRRAWRRARSCMPFASSTSAPSILSGGARPILDDGVHAIDTYVDVWR